MTPLALLSILASMHPSRLALCATIVGLATSCTRPATQLLAVVSTDVPSGAYTCVRVEVTRVPGEAADLATRGYLVPAETTLPLWFGIVPPDGDAARRVEVGVELRADACESRRVGEPAPLVRRVVRTGFLPEQTLWLPIFLAARCRDVLCGEAATCSPETGACEPTPELDPVTLVPVRLRDVRPREELLDGGTGTLDTGLLDTGLLDTGLLPDTGVPRDAGPPRDAWLPDGGPGCGTSATLLRTAASAGTLVDFSLAASTDGAQGLRGLVLRGMAPGADWAGAEDLGGGSPGSSYSPPAGSASGPTGVAFLADGSARAVVFGYFGGIQFSPLFGFSNDVNLGGACPSNRCVVGVGGEFAVLRGPATLTLVQVTVSPLGRGATARTGTSVAVASGTTGGGVRPAASGVLVSYEQGGTCFVERWPDFVASTGRLMIPACTRVDAAELSSGEVGIGWIDAANAVHAGVADSALGSLGPTLVLDSTQAMPEPVEVAANALGFRVSWVDDAVPLVRSTALDVTATPLANDCAATAGHLLEDYRRFHAVRRGTTSAVEWTRGNDFYGATFSN